MWTSSLRKTSCCHPVENPFHSGCPVQMIVFCGTSTPKQCIGLTGHYATKHLMAENGLQMAITLLLKGIRTSPFGTVVQGLLSQSLTSVDTSIWGADCVSLQMDVTLLELMRAELDYGT